MIQWPSGIPLQESSEPVPLAGRVGGQELKHTLSFEQKHVLDKEQGSWTALIKVWLWVQKILVHAQT